MKKFEVKIYYTTFCSYQISAEDEKQAFDKVGNNYLSNDEALSNMKRWPEADSVERIKK